jgi:hypothetical protein
MAFDIIPETPSFSTQIARGLGGGLGAGINKSVDFAQQMALQKQKNTPLEALLSMGPQEGGKFTPLNPQQEAALAFTDPAAFNAYQSLKGSYQKEEEQQTKHQDLGNLLNKMSDTLKKGKLGYSIKKFATPEGRRDASYFDALGVELESIAKDMVSKGVLARDRFAYLLSNLPSSGKTDAANAGSIEAWADELKLPRPEGLESLYKKSDVLMVDPEGNRYKIPSGKVSQAEKQGFKRQ